MQQATVGNRLLKNLPPEVFGLLRPYMSHVELPLKTVLVHPNAVTQHVYFLESGLGSVIATSPDGEITEVGHNGFDGMSGTHIVLMSQRVPSTTLMQVAGSGIRIPSGPFLDIIEASYDARRLLLRYVQAYQIQVAYTALANIRYEMPQRLARWLLMSHDRIRSDDIPLTHQFLSIMLGVRRSGVTDQLHKLEGDLAIRSTRGMIHIRDRAKLEDIAGGCYGVPESEYERLVGEVASGTGTEKSEPVRNGEMSHHWGIMLVPGASPLCDPVAAHCEQQNRAFRRERFSGGRHLSISPKAV